MLSSDIKYQHLLGKPFEYGVTDCYTLFRDFYIDNFGITMRDYARPWEFWNKGINLYQDNMPYEGFRPFDTTWRDLQIGDVMLMTIRSNLPNHCAIYVGNGNIIHHLPDKPSEKVPFKFRNMTVSTWRHPQVSIDKPTPPTVDIKDFLLPTKRRLIDD